MNPPTTPIHALQQQQFFQQQQAYQQQQQQQQGEGKEENVSMGDRAAKVLVQVKDARTGLTVQSKALNSTQEQANEAIRQHLLQTGLPYQQVGKKYAYIERVRVPHPFNPSLVKSAFTVYMRKSTGKIPSPAAVEAYMEEIERCQIELAGWEDVLKFSKTKPANSLVLAPAMV